MKIIVYSSCLLAILFTLSCVDSGNTITSSEDDVINYTGTITKIFGDDFGIIADPINGDRERFDPKNLPLLYKQEGLRVLFSGKRGEIPANVRLWGTPLKLSSIQTDLR